MKNFILNIIFFINAASSYILAQAPSKSTQENNSAPSVNENSMNINMNATSGEEKAVISIGESMKDAEDLNRTDSISSIPKSKKEASKMLKADKPVVNDASFGIVAPSGFVSETEKRKLFVQNSQTFDKEYNSMYRSRISRSAMPEQQMKMNGALGYMNASYPNEYETQVYNYLNSNYNPGYQSFLDSAKSNLRTQNYLNQLSFANEIVKMDYKSADSIYVNHLYNSVFDSSFTVYANNLMLSCPPNSTLILHTLTDFSPVFNFQQNNNIANEKNVRLISLELMKSDVYRTSLIKEGFVLPKSTFIDTAYFRAFCSLNLAKNIRVSMTIPKEYFESLNDDLVPVGLTFAFKKEFAGKNHDHNYFNDIFWRTSWSKSLNPRFMWSANYVPALKSLEYYYQENKSKEQYLVRSKAEMILPTSSISKKKFN